jgi:hypothetical protein
MTTTTRGAENGAVSMTVSEDSIQPEGGASV